MMSPGGTAHDGARRRSESEDQVTEFAEGPADGASEWKQVGLRIRAARLGVGMSIRELARRVDVSPQHVSQVERGIGSFSAAVLYAVANTLGISMDSLFEPTESPAPSRPAAGAARAALEGTLVLRRADRPRIHLRGGQTWERLTPLAEHGAEFLEVVHPPTTEGGSDSGLVRHEGREYGVILSGTLLVDVGFETTVLGPGDSIAFDSMTPHRFRNVTETETRAIWFVLENGGFPHDAAAQSSPEESLLRRYEQRGH